MMSSSKFKIPNVTLKSTGTFSLHFKPRLSSLQQIGIDYKNHYITIKANSLFNLL